MEYTFVADGDVLVVTHGPMRLRFCPDISEESDDLGGSQCSNGEFSLRMTQLTVNNWQVQFDGDDKGGDAMVTLDNVAEAEVLQLLSCLIRMAEFVISRQSEP
jgi:hypothetical protein